MKIKTWNETKKEFNVITKIARTKIGINYEMQYKDNTAVENHLLNGHDSFFFASFHLLSSSVFVFYVRFVLIIESFVLFFEHR